MSARWCDTDATPRLLQMQVAQVDAVMAVEAATYTFPWSRGNFIDSLAAAYPSRVLLGERDALLGYFVAMAGVDEMHLLNITVAPAAQGCGHARTLLEALIVLARAQPAHALWLEVRESNAKARAMYSHFGFAAVGRRGGYYPAALGRREDAVVMSLTLSSSTGGANDALG